MNAVIKQTFPYLRRRKPSTFNNGLGRRLSGFSFAGAKKLDDILKVDLIKDMTKAKISDIWLTYQEKKERVYRDIISGKNEAKILDRTERK